MSFIWFEEKNLLTFVPPCLDGVEFAHAQTVNVNKTKIWHFSLYFKNIFQNHIRLYHKEIYEREGVPPLPQSVTMAEEPHALVGPGLQGTTINVTELQEKAPPGLGGSIPFRKRRKKNSHRDFVESQSLDAQEENRIEELDDSFDSGDPDFNPFQ